MIEENIKEIIKREHNNDNEQIEVIFSDKKRILVEAPAGCGKTKTMISKIAYMIATKQICNPKKILVLTFSVNAAYKIKKELSSILPSLLSRFLISPLEINNNVFVSNYHGFCRRILKLYGYLLDENLAKIEYLKGVDDDKPEKLVELKIGLPSEVADQISSYSDAIKTLNKKYLNKYFEYYIEKIKEYFLPNGYIPFNAILLLTLKLFSEYERILDFYRSYYPIIIIDEFQDTNILGWTLLKKLVTENTHLMIMGDSLQRIYGFIGAIPNIMEKAKQKFGLYEFKLSKNYRYNGNEDMLTLDKNVRKIAQNPLDPAIEKNAIVDILEFSNQIEEANGIISLIKKILGQTPSAKIAILVKQRSKNTSIILDLFGKNNISYFYALYSEEDVSYINFHQMLLQEFIDIVSTYKNRFNKTICNKIIQEARKIVNEKNEDKEIVNSLFYLFQIFLEKIFTDFNFLSMEEKIELIRDVLENKALKQYMGYIDANIIISTIHGAKGLEWEYVILPDLEQYSFPNWKGLCGKCRNKQECEIDWNQADSNFEKEFYEELNLFYVGVTRARKKVYFTWSKKRLNKNNKEEQTKLSCLLRLPGIIHRKNNAF
ncbi:UvrD-helicase domain-containing protein [Caldicellulosiruptor sp. DIB 104C]|uniref:UvrD-helicase domain-containing protein n=1 Tax=Caldicellulosiruptor sp. DIB 104C TaxID=3019889 RepID=UPI002306027E|nr:ATP-dependent helicase [Caldicellulosiruptor sp. DIB 104C]